MHSKIDIPFEQRNTCWFCGEPNQYSFDFPQAKNDVLQCVHPPLSIPACKECFGIVRAIHVDDIWTLHQRLKAKLIRKYHKDLAIGVNWTREELENSEFDGGNFEGFKRSAWFMFEVAKSRVNYLAWPLSVDGIELLNETDKPTFLFDGVQYPNIDEAIEHYSTIFLLPKVFFKQLVHTLGEDKFSYAIRVARINIDATPNEQRRIIHSFL